jgi:tRNA U38,U39,U40 pseudouridine synthase TruA
MEIKLTLTEEEHDTLTKIISSGFCKHLLRRIVRRPVNDINEESSVEDFVSFLVKNIASNELPFLNKKILSRKSL